MERLPFSLRCFVFREERLSQGHGAEPFRVGDVEVHSAVIILFISWGAHRAKLESLSSLSSQIEPDPQPVVAVVLYLLGSLPLVHGRGVIDSFGTLEVAISPS